MKLNLPKNMKNMFFLLTTFPDFNFAELNKMQFYYNNREEKQ